MHRGKRVSYCTSQCRKRGLGDWEMGAGGMGAGSWGTGDWELENWGLEAGESEAKAPSLSVGIEIFRANDFCKSVYGLASEVVFA